AQAGADLLVETLCGLQAGTIKPQPQDNAQATLAPIIKKEDGLIDWNLPAQQILNRMRGFVPWPGTYTVLNGHVFHIWRAAPSDARKPGELEAVGRRLFA